MLSENAELAVEECRRQFFRHVRLRQFTACQSLIEGLQSPPQPWIEDERQYLQAVLLCEQRQFDRAETILRPLLEKDLRPVQRARVLLLLAIGLDELGDWAEAEQLYLEAADVYQRIDDKLGIAKVYLNRGVSICFQFEYGTASKERVAEALEYHRKALQFAEEVNELGEIANNWHGIARAYGLLGEYQQALDAFVNHQEFCHELNDLAYLAINYSDLAALVHMPQKQWEAAEETLNQAIAILQDEKDELHLAEALARRGKLHLHHNRPNAALASFIEAIRHVESIRNRLNAPIARATYRATVDLIYKAPLSIYLRQGNFDAAFTIAERARSRVLIDLLANQQPAAGIPEELLEKWHGVRTRLDEAYANQQADDETEALEKALAELDRQMEMHDRSYVGLTGATSLNSDEVRQHLPENAALLTYVSDDAERLWILVVTREGVEGHPIPRISIQWLQQLLGDHIDGMRRGTLVPDDDGYLAQPKRLMPPLFQALLAPVWDILASHKTIYIVPHGPIYAIPVGALTPDLSQPAPLLTSGRNVVYAPSATILFRYCHQASPSRARTMLAIAPADEHLRYIIGASERIGMMDSSMSIARSQATRQAFLAQADQHKIICFFGHAIFDPIRPMASRLVLSDGHLRAGELSRELRLQADLVILAACETGRSKILHGDELLGLTRALLHAGTPSILVTLWPVHEVPTRLLIEQFMAQIQEQPVQTYPRILVDVQNWLRELTFDEAHAQLSDWQELAEETAYQQLAILWRMTHPDDVPDATSRLFSHPYFWSPFVLIGDQRRV